MRIGYARVSTADQNPDAQRDALTAAGCEKSYVDHGESGRKSSRPQWDACLADLRRGDVLVVCKLDRAARSVRHLLTLVDDLGARGVDLLVLNNPALDTTSSVGKLLFTIVAAVAEFESDLNHERTRDGLAAARARGRVGGRKMKFTPAQAEAICAMYDARAKTVDEIAAVFGTSRRTVYDYLARRDSAAKAAS